MVRKSVLALAVLTLAACSQPPAPTTTAQVAPAPASTSLAIPPPPIASKNTPEAWRSAFDSSFHIVGATQDVGDGVYKFSACFDPVAPEQMNKCKVGASVDKDGFRKLWIFTPRLSSILDTGANDMPFVSSYVSVRENMAPKILLSAHYIGSDWLFMTSMAIMVDGDVVLEQNFGQTGEVKTHVGSGYVEERSDFILTDQQLAALRKVHPGSNVIIRLTGKNGYTSIDSGKSRKGLGSIFNANSFTYDVQELLGIYDGIDAKTKGKEVLAP